MGTKKVSIRTLATGEKVTDYPDGRQVLVPSNRMADRLTDKAEELEAASVDQLQARLAAVEDKRAKQREGDPVPRDKSPL